MDKRRIRTNIWVSEENKSHEEAWLALSERMKEKLNNVVQMICIHLDRAKCQYHPESLAVVSLSYEKATDITSSDVTVCCFVFAEALQLYFNEHLPMPVNVGFLRPLDQRTQN